MNARVRDVMVGLTTIVGLALLGAVLLLFGWVPRFIQDGYTVKVQMNDASGLGAGAVVSFRGVSIGEVDKVYLSEDGTTVFVDLFIHMQHSLPSDIYARAEGALIGGISALQLQVPRIRPSEVASNSDELQTIEGGTLPKDGSAVIPGKIESITDSLSEQLDDTSAQLTQQLGAFQKDFSRAVDSMVKLSASWTGVGNNIQAMTTPGEPGDGKVNINHLMTQADARLSDIGKTLAKLDKTVTHVNSVITDEQLNKDIKGSVAKAKDVLVRLDETVIEYKKVASTGQKEMIAMSAKAVSLLDSLDKAATNLNTTMTAAREGKGTMGKLINDPALYNNLEESAKRLSLVLEEVNRLLTKLQVEGLPLSLK